MKQFIADLLSKHVKLKKEEVLNLIEIPPDTRLGDYAFPCFKLAPILKKAPKEIAEELAEKMNSSLPHEIEKVEAFNGYLNFLVNLRILVESTLKVLDKKDKKANKKTALVESPSPNTNKPLHLGHLRNMAIGEAVSRILESQNFNVKRLNLNNDRGVHITKSMLAYSKWGKGKSPKDDTDKFVGDFYVLYGKKLKDHPELEQENQELLIKWEASDKKTLALWKKMNDWAYKGFKETYKNFGMKFDREYYESQTYKKAKEIVTDGLKKGVFKKKTDGAIIADLEKYGLGEKVVLRADGTSVYVTQDLYLAKLKYEQYKFDKSIYVVASEQDYHFKVLFKILELLKLPFAKKALHLSYGMVNLPEGRMKSREGKVVDADDLINEMQELAKKELKKRTKLSKKELEERSLKIALASIKYFLLKVEISKDMVFNPQEAIAFEGNSGPYLQYSYARASSILRKSKKKGKLNLGKLLEFDKEEIALVKKLGQFSEVLDSAHKSLNPALVANYSFELAQLFNEFYHTCPVIDSDKEEFRLFLIEKFRKIIKEALFLLGIEVMEEM
ncbi:MAG: arginine--tRNA ligase [archaeon]